MTDHHHYWKLIGSTGHRWYAQHALIRCIQRGCLAWSVTEYGTGIGPCAHAVALAGGLTELSPMARFPLPTELTQCPDCGSISEGVDCPYCEGDEGEA